MAYLLNPGSQKDNASIPLATRLGNWIPNERRREHPPERLKQALADWKAAHPFIQLRSLTATYNCAGMVFANRRTVIAIQNVPPILEDDGFREISFTEAALGDIIVYFIAGGLEHAHVGLVARQDNLPVRQESDLTILSQWGADGEYLHRPADVPNSYGSVRRYFSDRVVIS